VTDQPKVHVVSNGDDIVWPWCDCGWEGEKTTDQAMAEIEAGEHARDSGHPKCC